MWQRGSKLTTLLLGCCCGDGSCRSCATRWSSCLGFPTLSIWCHIWSWWCLWTLHSQHIPPFSAASYHRTLRAHKLQTSESVCLLILSFLFKDKNNQAQNQETQHSRSLHSNIPRLSPCRDGLKLTSKTEASLIFIAAILRVFLSSTPVYWVAYPPGSAIQHLGHAAPCQCRRWSMC